MSRRFSLRQTQVNAILTQNTPLQHNSVLQSWNDINHSAPRRAPRVVPFRGNRSRARRVIVGRRVGIEFPGYAENSGWALPTWSPSRSRKQGWPLRRTVGQPPLGPERHSKFEQGKSRSRWLVRTGNHKQQRGQQPTLLPAFMAACLRAIERKRVRWLPT